MRSVLRVAGVGRVAARPAALARAAAPMAACAAVPRGALVAAAPRGLSTKADKALLKTVESELADETNYMKAEGDKKPAVPAGWKVKETAGDTRIELHSTNGDEQIVIKWDIPRPEDMPQEDPEQAQEDAPAEEGEDYYNDQLEVPFEVTITRKSSNSALGFFCTAAGDAVDINGIVMYPTAQTAHASTPEAEWAKSSLYQGPAFSDLADNLQEEFRNFLSERSVNDQVASFILEYSSHREQHEYVNWLTNVRKFLKA